MKLTQKQTKELESKDWIVKPEGCYIELYQEDYSSSAWIDICSVVGSSFEATSVTLLVFGYNNYNV